VDDQDTYQVVVTYRDSNYVWKDRTIDPSDVTDRMLGPTERELTCVTSALWSGIPRSAQMRHLGVTIHNRTATLAWPPPVSPPSPKAAVQSDQSYAPGRVDQDRILHILLHSTLGGPSFTVAWGSDKP